MVIESPSRAKAKRRFAIASRLEKEYVRSLRMVTNQIDHMVKGMVASGGIENSEALQSMLKRYAETIEPWAQSVANKMVTRIAKQNGNEWIALSGDVGKSLRRDLQNSPVEHETVKFMQDQVHLIKSLPLESAERVHRLTIEGLTTGRRADEISKDILETGKVSLSRARLIARTEVARTASGLTMVRAQHVGSTHYYWRTSGDGDVRDSHKAMANKIIEWANPPEVDPGKRYHAGQFPNCRCYPEPILDDIDQDKVH